MRFTNFTLAAFVAGAGIAQVSAAPIRVVIISPASSPPSNIHLAHLSAPDVSAVPPHMHKRPHAHGCAGRMSRFRQKGIEISNAFRQALGLPLIAVPPPHYVHIKPMIHGPTASANGNGNGATSVGMLQVLPHPLLGPVGAVPEKQRYRYPDHVHGYAHGHGHGRNGSFASRLVYSLMNLGRWEGRAVAFVLGCGIGVLLRMFWVLAIVLYRSVRGPSSSDEHEYTHVMIVEEYDDADAEDAAVPPPVYTYPVDEKSEMKAMNSEEAK